MLVEQSRPTERRVQFEDSRCRLVQLALELLEPLKDGFSHG